MFFKQGMSSEDPAQLDIDPRKKDQEGLGPEEGETQMLPQKQ